MRCLTVANTLRAQQVECVFICRPHPGNLIDTIRVEGFTVIELSAPPLAAESLLQGYARWLSCREEDDARECIEAIEGEWDAVIVDHYGIGRVWENTLRTIARQVVVIDDLANREHDCDILIDQNYYIKAQERYRHYVANQTTLLLGPKYSILRPEFYAQRGNASIRSKISNILIFYGSMDSTGETVKALRALSLIDSDLLQGVAVHVVVGKLNKNKEVIASLCASDSSLHYHEQVDNMAQMICQCDLALGAGGTTTWERAFLLLPTIVTVVADNQRELTHTAHNLGIIHYLGTAETVGPNDIAESVSSLLMNPIMIRNLSLKCRELFEAVG